MAGIAGIRVRGPLRALAATALWLFAQTTAASAAPPEPSGAEPTAEEASEPSPDETAEQEQADDTDATRPEPRDAIATPAGLVAETSEPVATVGRGLSVGGDTWFEFHGYARMPINLQATPREPWLVDSDYYLSGFAYTRLYEPDWSELYFSAHHGDYRVQFGMFASLYSDYATAELENQMGIAQASVAADNFLGREELSAEVGVFWDRFGYIEPYDTYLFGRTHQGGLKLRWSFSERSYLQAGVGVHERLGLTQGMTPIGYLAGGVPVGPDVVAGGYLIKAWTRDKPQFSTIEDGDLLIAGTDLRYRLPAELGSAYGAFSYIEADSSLFLAPVIEVIHSTGGRGLTENFFGLESSDNGTGSLFNFALDAPLQLTPQIGVRAFGMATWALSEQSDPDDPMVNKDRRMYLKWGVEPSYRFLPTVRGSVRFDRVILDLYDAENSFRVLSPRVSFPLSKWGELFVQYSRYFYGDKVKLRPNQVPGENDPDENVFKVQAQAVW